jgi:hypothetical protein
LLAPERLACNYAKRRFVPDHIARHSREPYINLMPAMCNYKLWRDRMPAMCNYKFWKRPAQGKRPLLKSLQSPKLSSMQSAWTLQIHSDF